jgi:penicillin-binding protein A
MGPTGNNCCDNLHCHSYNKGHADCCTSTATIISGAAVSWAQFIDRNTEFSDNGWCPEDHTIDRCYPALPELWGQFTTCKLCYCGSFVANVGAGKYLGMKFTRAIGRLVFGILIVFGLVALSATYWAIVGPNTIADRPDNPRRVEQESRIRRGDILDRRGTLLVTSLRNEDGSSQRQYLYPAIFSALGYSSLRYGTAGAEAAFNTVLRGDDLEIDFVNFLRNLSLHSSQVGSDIQLTFDLSIQEAAVESMGTNQGSVVVLEVPSGQVLAMVSLPTYDPNILDENWETLTQAPGNPFFNRALQGAYQPGGVLQTSLLATAILSSYPINVEIEDAPQPVKVNNVTLTCLLTPNQTRLTLTEAYNFGCPYPFLKLVQDLGTETVGAAFDIFQFDNPPTLPGYVIPQVEESAQTTSIIESISNNLIADALGQGELTVSPLEMAALAAAVINDGNSPTPTTLLSIRRPSASVPEPAVTAVVNTPMITASTARELQSFMRQVVVSGTAQQANQDDLADIGGHLAVAFTGDSIQTWFVGFAGTADGGGVAIAVVVENPISTDEMAILASEILASAIDALQ